MLSEKHAVKLFEKRLSSAFLAVCPYSCFRILVQSMVQVFKKKKIILFASFAEELFGICYFTCIFIFLQNDSDLKFLSSFLSFGFGFNKH